MREIDNYPRPWRTTKTPRAHKTGGGHNYHIRAANGMYVAERLMGGEDVAALIVESVNERKESIASLRTQLATMAELNNSQREILHTVAVERDALALENAGLRYYIAQLERNVSPAEREYAAQVAQMQLAE